MKMFLAALCMMTGAHAFANTVPFYQIQKFPGKVKIEADINVTHADTGALDVLFVVDNSGSMDPNQKKMAAASAMIDTAFSQTNRDFHLGVVSTDTSGDAWTHNIPGALLGSPTVLTKQDMPGALAKKLMVGTQGAADERPFDSVRLALSEPLLSGANTGFLRPGAALAVVLLTNAEDQSSMTADEFSKFVVDVKGDARKVTLFSWIVPSSLGTTSSCDRDDYNIMPTKIEAATQSLNGQVYNICDMQTADVAAFAQRLSQFGETTNPTPPSAEILEIPLTIAPVVSSIEVRYGTQVLVGGDIHQGWVYDSVNNSVILGKSVPWSVQKPGTKLEVSFVPADWLK